VGKPSPHATHKKTVYLNFSKDAFLSFASICCRRRPRHLWRRACSGAPGLACLPPSCERCYNHDTTSGCFQTSRCRRHMATKKEQAPLSRHILLDLLTLRILSRACWSEALPGYGKLHADNTKFASMCQHFDVQKPVHAVLVDVESRVLGPYERKSGRSQGP